MTEEQIRAWAVMAAAMSFASLPTGVATKEEFYDTANEYARYIRSGHTP